MLHSLLIFPATIILIFLEHILVVFVSELKLSKVKYDLFYWQAVLYSMNVQSPLMDSSILFLTIMNKVALEHLSIHFLCTYIFFQEINS